MDARRTAIGGQVDEAVALFKQWSAQSLDLPDYQLRLPASIFDAGRETQAIEMLEKSVAGFPERPEYREELAFLYERRAIQLCLRDKFPEAVSILRKLAKEFPERPGHRRQLVRQVTVELRQEQAVGVFQKLMHEFPDAVEYRDALARSLEQAGRPEDAEALLKGAAPGEKPKQ